MTDEERINWIEDHEPNIETYESRNGQGWWELRIRNVQSGVLRTVVRRGNLRAAVDAAAEEDASK